jgi:hypothetical protein
MNKTSSAFPPHAYVDVPWKLGNWKLQLHFKALQQAPCFQQWKYKKNKGEHLFLGTV